MVRPVIFVINHASDIDKVLDFLKKGGDPAAPSDTATLLRLSASYRFYLRRFLPKLGHRLRVPPASIA